jgi:hypothetical protein
LAKTVERFNPQIAANCAGLEFKLQLVSRWQQAEA